MINLASCLGCKALDEISENREGGKMDKIRVLRESPQGEYELLIEKNIVKGELNADGDMVIEIINYIGENGTDAWVIGLKLDSAGNAWIGEGSDGAVWGPYKRFLEGAVDILANWLCEFVHSIDYEYESKEPYSENDLRVRLLEYMGRGIKDDNNQLIESLRPLFEESYQKMKKTIARRQMG